jgi:hypothetical protein
MYKREKRQFTGSQKAAGQFQFIILRVVLAALVLAIFFAGMLLLPGKLNKVNAQPNPGGKPSADRIWQISTSASLEQRTEKEKLPHAYSTTALNQEALNQVLSQAPMEFTEAAKNKQVVITLPMPGGEFAEFRIEESPVMHPDLAAQYPEIKTYKGQGIDDPTATTRFDWTPLGLRAIILSLEGTVFVEPFSQNDKINYISYFNKDISIDNISIKCDVENKEEAKATAQSPLQPAFATGTTLRTYRLAVAATGEFTQQYGGGNVSTTLTQITSLVNQINAVYQKEATITFQLIANETSIIFTNATTDGYTNDPQNIMAMLAENQTKLDSVIGSANYDIGHVFGGLTVQPGFLSFSGLAQLSVVCSAGNKGKGASLMGGSPITHSIFVKGVAHEFAHQFSAPHSFNTNESNCASQRQANGAYEPGAGSTIMSYSICGASNLQSQTDMYFHTSSLDKIVTWATGSGNCAAQTSTGNSAPVISTLSNFTIPANTPFTLDGSATDPNGDALTYVWEQYDLGTVAPPHVDDGTRPILRSFIPTTTSARTFPKLQYILNNANVPPTTYACGSATCLTGEVLPSVARTMNFRFTARDNRASGGGTANAASQVTVVATAGPFTVTQPNTAVSWTGGSSQTITWNVAGTTAAPISAANVKISLSTDGGNNFPTVLAASTPNDGSQAVTIPNTPTTNARIKVEAVGNIFFDISNTSFTITAGTSAATLTVASVNPASGVSITVSPNDTGGLGNGTTQFTRTYNLNTTVSLTAPATASGNNFQKWQRDGVDFSTNQGVNVTMDTNHTMTAVYVTSGSTPPPFGFDSDALSDLSVWRPTTGVWFIRNSSNGSTTNVGWGVSGDELVPGDYDGDGRFDIAVWRPTTGVWYIRNSSNGSTTTIGWGVSTDIVVPADYDNDGKTDLAVWRPSSGSWLIRNSSNGSTTTFVWGTNGDVPMPGDYDGDGLIDYTAWRPTNGTWYIRNSSTGSFTGVGWGIAGDKLVPGDFDGDNKSDVAVWRPSTGVWYIRNSSNGSITTIGWGVSTDSAVPADYDGDGKTDVAVWRNGTWFIRNSSNGSTTTPVWGTTGDEPVPSAFVR